MRQVLGPGALWRPRGMGWRRRWEGGLGLGIHVNPWLIHVNVWQETLQYCKVIRLQLIKINEKKNLKSLLIIDMYIQIFLSFFKKASFSSFIFWGIYSLKLFNLLAYHCSPNSPKILFISIGSEVLSILWFLFSAIWFFFTFFIILDKVCQFC